MASLVLGRTLGLGSTGAPIVSAAVHDVLEGRVQELLDIAGDAVSRRSTAEAHSARCSASPDHRAIRVRMATKNNGIPLGQVRPFYQVVVFSDPNGWVVNLKDEVGRIAKERARKDSTFSVKGYERKKGLQYVHVVHTLDPSWVRGASRFKDTEHDEAMLYQSGPYMFVHSNCSALLEALVGAFSEALDRVKAGDIEKLLAQRRVEIRALGMQNLNAPGRTAPEGKTHFARDATYTLSPSTDSMYAFKYGFAVERRAGSKRAKPFGCSTTKRKVWGTWVDDADAFVAECDRLSSDLQRPDPGKRNWVLATRVAKPPSGISPIGFYADYSVHRKGMLWLDAGKEWSADWTCYLNGAGMAQFEVTKMDGSLVTFELAIERKPGALILAYPSGAEPRKVKVCDDSGDLERRQSHDLVRFLNDEEAFTVVFTRGLSYREGEYWKNGGLADVFSKLRTSINWDGIDISAESLSPGRTDTIGDGILRHLRAAGWPEVVMCDDGANEVADYVVIGKERIALIHAKYSSEATPGLRVGDLQEVLAQCLKNLQFFQWPVIESHAKRLGGEIQSGFKATTDVQQVLRAAYENQRSKKECWVVQPGISATKLSAAPSNKIHSLLNYAESACLPGNVEFHFYCSP
jgi:hypothetical protein